MRSHEYKMDPQRAKNIGRLLFHKYDTSRKGSLQPKQCFQMFSDYCYRILNIANPPSLQEAPSMFNVLDQNRDQKVTEADFESLAVKFLCGQGFGNRSTFMSNREALVTTVEKKQTVYTSAARKRLDVIRRLFKKYDQDGNGFLTQDQIPYILRDTYAQMGYSNYKPSQEDIKSYMNMVDSDRDGKVTLDQFQSIVLKSLQKAGIQIYQ